MPLLETEAADDDGGDDASSVVSTTPSLANEFHGNEKKCAEKGKWQHYMIFVVDARNRDPYKCHLCVGFSNEAGPIPNAHARDKHGGCRPWFRYKRWPKKLEKRVRLKLCLICVMVFR